jgi:hypothetical protein
VGEFCLLGGVVLRGVEEALVGGVYFCDFDSQFLVFYLLELDALASDGVLLLGLRALQFDLFLKLPDA